MVTLKSSAAWSTPLPLGMGFNWFDFLGMGGLYNHSETYPLHVPTYPPMEDQASWDLIRQGLDELRPSFFRFGLPPDAHINPDLSLKTGTVHLRRLRWLNDWCERQGAVIWIDTFVIPDAFSFPRPARLDKGGYMAPRDNREFARKFIAPLMRHLTQDLGLGAVRWFNLVNEPVFRPGSFETPNLTPHPFAHYVDTYRCMREELDAAGIPEERVALIGIDTFPDHMLMVPVATSLGVDLNPHVKAYSAHYYNGRLDYLPWQEGSHTSPLRDIAEMAGHMASYTRSREKLLVAGEIGCSYYGWRSNNPTGTASFDAALTTAETAVRLLNIGLGGGAFWSILNPDTIDGWWGVMRVENGRLERRPHPYAVYGSLCRHIRLGDTVIPLDPGYQVGDVHGSAFESPDGRRSLVLVNSHPVLNRSVTLKLPPSWAGKTFSWEICDRVRLATPLPSPTAGPDGSLLLELPGFSVNALATR